MGVRETRVSQAVFRAVNCACSRGYLQFIPSSLIPESGCRSNAPAGAPTGLDGANALERRATFSFPAAAR